MAGTPEPTYSQARMFYLPTLLSALYALLTSFAIFYLPVYFKETLGFSGGQIGLLFGAYGVTAVLAVFPSGLSTDFVTPKRVLFVAAVVTVFATLGLAKFTAFPVYLAVFLVFGLAGNSVKVAAESFIFKTHDTARTGRTFGVYQVFRMGAYGTALLSGGYLLQAFGFPTTLIVFAVCVAGVAVGTAALPDIPAQWSGFAMYAKDIRRPEVAVFAVWIFLFTSHWGAETTCYALFLRENLHFSLIEMGRYMSGEFVAYMLTAYTIGKRYDAGLDLGRVLWIGVLLAGIGHIGMTYPWWPSSFAFRVLHGVGDGCVSVVMYVGVSRLFLRERVGGNSGLINLVMMLGVLVGATIYGPLGEALGYQVPLLISGAIMIALGLFPQLHRGASGIGLSHR